MKTLEKTTLDPLEGYEPSPIYWQTVKELKTSKDALGPHSGLTKRELAATGTCETDWF